MWNSVTRRTALGFAALVAALGLGAGASAQTPPPIKIGAFLAVTGPASFLGDPEAKTLRLYIERQNRLGGVLGRPLQLVLYDTGGAAPQAVTFARRLIEDDKVDLIIGGSTTGETMAVVPVVTEAEIPFISLAGAVVVVEPVKKWVFKTPHTDRMAVEMIFRDMKRDNLTNAAILGGAGGFDQSCRQQAKELAPKMGITIVGDETYGPGDSDHTPQLTKIRGAAGVQAIVGCGFGDPTVISARNFRQLGMTTRFYFNHGVGSQQFIDKSGGAAEGMRMPVAALLVADLLADADPQKKVAQEYARVYGEAYKEPISTFGGHAYDGLFLAIDAMRRANSSDKARVRDALEQTKGFIGADGIFNMSPSDHMGLTLDSFKMVEVRNNTWRLLY